MATKKVYFNQIKLFRTDSNQLSTKSIKKIFSKVFDKYAVQVQNEDYYSLILSNAGEDNITMDIISDTEEYLFCRVGKRKESSSMLLRDYNTYGSNDVLTPQEAITKGVEIFTYFLLNYDTHIFGIVSTQAAPSGNIINRILRLHHHKYYTEVINIPNQTSVKKLYDPGSEISKITINLPIPDAEYLEKVLGLNENQIIDIVKDDIRSLTLVVQSEARRPLTTESSKITRILDAISATKEHYNKAVLRGKGPNEKMQDFDFKAGLFSYPIDIRAYHVENGQRIYYNISEITEEFYNQLLEAYRTNREDLIYITNSNNINEAG
ncbi:hypothetical protein HZI73_12580 [Vallitalea pronyensis]|uniref:Uncharacterized protein n=1 Tax=Vallitalea pronyensis TaxID=1348613 RepID=A0A8J8MJQ5_9FIRM|nr:hypothetical protein [Vallitalea pronyensis]QUI23072.1 hypothetical protein HZI73_12580 [Vallitalea pronyensis]